MFVVNRKRLSIILVGLFLSIFAFSYQMTKDRTEVEVPVTATPVSGKVVILDARAWSS